MITAVSCAVPPASTQLSSKHWTLGQARGELIRFRTEQRPRLISAAVSYTWELGQGCFGTEVRARRWASARGREGGSRSDRGMVVEGRSRREQIAGGRRRKRERMLLIRSRDKIKNPRGPMPRVTLSLRRLCLLLLSSFPSLPTLSLLPPCLSRPSFELLFRSSFDINSPLCLLPSAHGICV